MRSIRSSKGGILRTAARFCEPAHKRNRGARAAPAADLRRRSGEKGFGFLHGFGEGFGDFVDGVERKVEFGENGWIEELAFTGEGVAELFAAANVIGDMHDAGEPAAFGS